MRDFLYPILKDFTKVFLPLRQSLASKENFETFLLRYGWDAGIEDEDMNTIHSAFAIESQLTDLTASLDTFINGTESEQAEAFLLLTKQLENLMHKLWNLSSATSNASFPVNEPSFWNELSENLISDLLATYLESSKPALFAIFHFTGVIKYEKIIPVVSDRIPFTKTTIDLEKLADFFTAPQELFKNNYNWNLPSANFNYTKLFNVLKRIFLAFRIPVSITVPREELSALLLDNDQIIPQSLKELAIHIIDGIAIGDNSYWKIGMVILPIPDPVKSNANPSGIALLPLLQGDLSFPINLSRDITLAFSGAFQADNLILAEIYPHKSSVNVLTETEIDAAIELIGSPAKPWILIGAEDSHKIELAGFKISYAVAGALSDPEVLLSIGTGEESATKASGCKVTIFLNDSDSFIKDSVNKSSLEFSFSLAVVWSSKTGFRFNGEASLDIPLPVNIKVGSVTLQNAHVIVSAGKKKTSTNGFELRFTAGLQGTFGPLRLEVDGLGLIFNAIPYSRQDINNLPPDSNAPLFGNLDLDLGFVPPKGIGIEVNASAVTGGGYLFFDPDKGEYAGVAQLTIQGKIIVKAIGIIQTKLPDGKPGYSFLLIITAEFPAIQLGMGFSLTGIGGLVGINRSIDMARLEAGIFNNAIDDVLFPADPLHNAYALINSINQIFPAASNQYTVAVMAQLAWGAASIVTIELGLILEFPEPLTVVLLGVIRAEVKKKLFGKEITALHLQVNFRISIEFDRKFIKLDAALYHSKLIGMELTGQMAVRVKYGSNPDFAISIGGFFPGFQPPALELPAKIERLQIILHSGNPYIAVGCYLAVTSNTIQFGISGTFKLEKYGCKILGNISFDALFQISPFHFEVDIHMFLGVSWHGYDLASIKLDGSFSGPSPWHVTGTLKLSVWIFSKTVHVNETWGNNDDAALEKVRVLPLLAQDIGAAANWERTSGSTGTLVSLRKDLNNEPDAEMLMLHPNELLAVRQNTVPLGINIDKFGARKPMGANKFNVQLIDKNNAEIPAGKVQNRFAPAQFIDMTDDQKLNAPSYELFDAGIHFEGLDNVMFDNFITIPVVYESRVIDDPAFASSPPAKIIEINTSFIHGLLNGSMSNSILGQLPRPKPVGAQTIREQYLVADAVTMKVDAISAVSSNSIQAMQRLKALRQADFYNKLNLTVLPIEEALS